MIKIFVGGFPLDVSELELVMLVSPYGSVSTIKIVRDKKTGICKGYAFLEISDRAGAEAIIEALDGSDFKGRELTISIKEEEPPKPASQFYKTQTQEVKAKRPRLKSK